MAMSNCVRDNLKFGCWNIHCLKTKLFDKSKDESFISNIDSYDILELLETKMNRQDVIDFGKYHSVSIFRSEEKNTCISGGIAILVNPLIKKGVSILERKCSEIQWLKLSKEFFGFENDIFLCYIYIAPFNSTYVLRNNLDIMGQLEQDLTLYSQKGNIIIFWGYKCKNWNRVGLC